MTIKTFQVNWDSVDDITHLLNRLKNRRGEISPEKSKRHTKRLIFDACNRIYNTDISPLYQNRNLDERKDYYVYAHLDTSKPIAIEASAITSFAATLGMKYFPFYIGKGTGQRAFIVNRNETHRKVKEKLRRLDKEISVFVIADKMNELQAYALEDKLIDIFGLNIFGGYLTNLDQGYLSQERMKLYLKDLRIIRGKSFSLYHKPVDIR